MSGDGLKRLPDHVVAPLLRALTCLPAPRVSSLILRPRHPVRPPVRPPNLDFDVLWREREVGRIWQHHYERHNWEHVGDWHWSWKDDAGYVVAEGHGATLEAMMAGFRQAWDGRKSGVA